MRVLGYYAGAHTRTAGRRIHHRPRTAAPSQTERRRGRGEGQRPGRPARVGTARTMTPASSSPSPAATAWRSGAWLKRRPPPAASWSAPRSKMQRPRAALNLHAQVRLWPVSCYIGQVSAGTQVQW